MPAVVVPPGVVTDTDAAPAPAGEVTVIDVAELAVTVPGLPLKATRVAFERFDPLMVTVVPPAAGPMVGLIEVITGAGT